MTVEVVQMTGELSEREQVLRRLPLPYSLALRLSRRWRRRRGDLRLPQRRAGRPRRLLPHR